jgi:DNA replication protein DnaC
MKSPFKFLDAYTAEDSAVFLGREEEVAALYDMVMKNRLILVYGQSGTGKTSLIQCGLASRFDVTDWMPLFVRRQNDLNRSLEQQLARVLGARSITSPSAAVSEIYLNFLRPVYLVFDQLEELFILGSAAEQDAFVKGIRDLLDSGTPCRILFVMREEYLAYLYGFERIIPTLFDRRLRVEAMGTTKVEQVLTGSFQQFNIGVQAPAKDTFAQIIDNISGGKAGIQLPYLQVYLDLLYREDFARTYPGKDAGEGGEWLPVEITRAEITALGKMDNVLERFLREQQDRLQKALKQSDPGVEEDAVKKVLDAFVSEEGTKRPISYEWKGDVLKLDERHAALFKPLSPSLTSSICRSLEQARLLRFGDSHIELAHDALAALIDSQRTAQQRRLRDALNRLSSAYREQKESGEYLSRGQLNSLEELMPVLEPRLSTEIKAFLKESQVKVAALEQAELVAERKKRRQARRIALAGFALALLALAGLYAAMVQYRAAARNAAEARRNFANTLKVEGKYEEALAQLAEIKQFEKVLSTAEQQNLEETRQEWIQVKELVRQGDSLKNALDFRLAIDRYQAAIQIDGDPRLANLATQAQKDLEDGYKAAVRDGTLLISTSGALDKAIQKFEEALKLKPGDTAVQQWLDRCRKKLQ